mmetsp:Transcript_39058/g.116019  ORF Transcript_39058/g.116019 Transcript_39058/m.116019 type:complete len:261 (+) Transcript_39058:277-1059(+)
MERSAAARFVTTPSPLVGAAAPLAVSVWATTGASSGSAPLSPSCSARCARSAARPRSLSSSVKRLGGRERARWLWLSLRSVTILGDPKLACRCADESSGEASSASSSASTSAIAAGEIDAGLSGSRVARSSWMCSSAAASVSSQSSRSLCCCSSSAGSSSAVSSPSSSSDPAPVLSCSPRRSLSSPISAASSAISLSSSISSLSSRSASSATPGSLARAMGSASSRAVSSFAELAPSPPPPVASRAGSRAGVTVNRTVGE